MRKEGVHELWVHGMIWATINANALMSLCCLACCRQTQPLSFAAMFRERPRTYSAQMENQSLLLVVRLCTRLVLPRSPTRKDEIMNSYLWLQSDTR